MTDPSHAGSFVSTDIFSLSRVTGHEHLHDNTDYAVAMLIMTTSTSRIITVRAVPSTANPWMVQSGHRPLGDAMTSANASMMSLRVASSSKMLD